MRRALDRRGGFTLLELVFAVFILTMGALALSAAMSSTERMNSLARERSIANTAVRSYVERMRHLYPNGQNDIEMAELIIRGISASGGRAIANDTTTDSPFSGYPDSTPIYDLARLYSDNAGNGFVEKTSVLKDVTATVYIATDETGTNWGPVIQAKLATPTTVTAGNVAGIASAISADDKTALGLPRDLNANGTTSETDVYAFENANSNNARVMLVPMKVELTWVTGSSRTVDSTIGRQKVTVYAIFSPQH